MFCACEKPWSCSAGAKSAKIQVVGPSRNSLLERERELSLLQAALAAARTGDGCVRVLEGSAGIGKTALLDAIRTLAADEGFEVLAARGAELEHEFAFGLARQLFEPALPRLDSSERAEALAGAAGLAERALGLAGADDGAGPVLAAGLHGLYWLAVNLADRGPLLLVVDDAHWGDVPSLRWLCYLAGRLEGVALAVLVATRPGSGESVASLLDELRREPAVEVLELAPLGEEGVRGLVELAFGERPADEFVSACREQSVGNPLLIRELAKALLADGQHPDVAAARRVVALPPQQALRAVLSQLGRLPAAASALAGAVAVLETDVQLRDAAVLAGLDERVAARAADSLVAAGILVAVPLLRFVHPLLRAAVYDDIAPARRASDHARAAALLRSDPAAAERVTAHLLASGPSGEPWVVDHLRAAARAALGRGAAENACTLLERALTERPAAIVRADIERELGAAKLRFAPWSAIEHLTAAREGLQAPDRIAVARELAIALAASARVVDAYDLLERTLSEIDSDDRELALTMEAELLAVGLLGPDLSARVDERIERIPPMSGETPGERLILANIARHRNLTGDPEEESADIAERALAGGQLLFDQTPDTPTFVLALAPLALMGRRDTVRALADFAVTHAERRGALTGLVQVSATLALSELYNGELWRAESEAAKALELSRQLRIVATIAVCVRTLVEVAIERGQLDLADALLTDNHLAGALPDMYVFFNFVLYARGCLRIAQGRTEEGIADFRELGERERRAGHHGPNGWRAELGPALVASGETECGRQIALEGLEIERRRGAPGLLGRALRGAAKAEGGAARIAYLREAMELLAPTVKQLEYAHVLADLGAALRRAGQRSEAREHLRHAADIAHRLGATVLAEEARQELLATGARPRKLTLTGIESLTASERRVAELAAEGMTNKQIAQVLFVTHKTVATHLAHTYSKLEINSRSEIAPKLNQ